LPKVLETAVRTIQLCSHQPKLANRHNFQDVKERIDTSEETPLRCYIVSRDSKGNESRSNAIIVDPSHNNT
jgi:hypothetical protein